METPQRYWSGLYWEGIDPEQIGAVDLSDASCEDDPTIDSMLTQSRQRVIDADQSVAEFAVSIIDMRETAGATESDSSGDPRSTQTAPTASSSAASPTSSALASAPASSSAVALSLSPDTSACSGRCVVVRLWHEAVFLGARESARGDPGALCRDLHFDPISARFLHQTTLEQTDQLMDTQAALSDKGRLGASSVE